MLDGELWVNNRTQINSNRIVYYKYQRKYLAGFEGPHREVIAECRQRQDMGYMSLLGSMDRVFWSPELR